MKVPQRHGERHDEQRHSQKTRCLSHRATSEGQRATENHDYPANDHHDYGQGVRLTRTGRTQSKNQSDPSCSQLKPCNGHHAPFRRILAIVFASFMHPTYSSNAFAYSVNVTHVPHEAIAAFLYCLITA